MPNEHHFLTAKEAAESLGISTATLYAYASRGQVHSETVPGRTRERRYHREDIERLKERKEARRDPAKVAARGLHWGSPVLTSAITLIENGKLYYRGRDVAELAANATLEQIAELLWCVEPSGGKQLLGQSAPLSTAQFSHIYACAKDPIVRMQAALPMAAAADLACYDLRPSAVRQSGARILSLFTTLCAGRASKTPIHSALQAAWAPGNTAVGEAIRMALVLCADHELNVSAFTARCAASAGASPYDTVAAALATLKGQRHGGATERASALFGEVESPKRAKTVLASLLRRGERVPGFGHPLYPTGDPRARLLLRAVETSGNREEWQLARALMKGGGELLQESPNLDFGLAALGRAFRLPAHAPLVLFALGRTVGWIAHAMEQYETNDLVRPRARYSGPAPIV